MRLGRDAAALALAALLLVPLAPPAKSSDSTSEIPKGDHPAASQVSADDIMAPDAGPGLASRYPGDAGIESDPAVVFAEDFEEPTIGDLTARWDEAKNPGNMSFSSDVPQGSNGTKSLLVTHTGGGDTGSHLYRQLLPGHDQLYTRFYVKFDPAAWDIHHFYHMGGYNPPTRWPQGGAGTKPNGDDRLSTGVEPYGSAWRWDFYSYWMEQRPCCGGSQYWGNDFVNDAALKVAKGQWISVELMMKMNADLAGRDGEQAIWIDGKLWAKDGQVISHLGPGFPKGAWTADSWNPDFNGQPFEGFRWRSDANLNLNWVWLLVYITTAPAGHVTKIWFDDLVVAKSYIGPIGGGGGGGNPCPPEAVLCEDFDDANFSARGWYDGSGGVISTTEKAPGSNSSLECFFAQAATSCSQRGPARHLFTEQDAVILEYWVKYSANWQGSGKPYHPHEFHFVTNKDDKWVGPAGTHLTMYVEEIAGRPRLALQDLKNVDKNCVLRNDNTFVGCNGNHSTYPFTENRSVASCNLLLGDLDGRDCFQTGSDWYSARFWDAPSGTKLDDNQWHKVRVLFQMNTISGGKGQVDGKMRYWLDGNLTLSYDRILYRTATNQDMKFNQFLITPYIGDGSPVDQRMWIDDLRVLKVTGGGGNNSAPQVSAGPDLTVTLPATASLDGTVTDDGLPNPPGRVTTAWTKVSGPGTVTFADPTAVDTTATFSAAGSYVLRLEGDDSALKTADEVTVEVKPFGGTNQAPTVSAGVDLAITLPATASLDGTASDDGLPDPPAKLTLAWSKVGGPGAVTFGDPNAAKTTASFASAGSYVLRLEGDDGALRASDEMSVEVRPPTGQDARPTVSILSPADGSTVSKQVTITVQAQDDVKVAKVSVLVDDSEIRSFTAAPYSVVWDSATSTDGDHRIKAVAMDSAGQSAETQVTVRVDNGGSGPPGKGDTSGLTASLPWILLAIIAVVAAIAALALAARRRRRDRPSQPSWASRPQSGEPQGWPSQGSFDDR